jgi:hypothetical protein
MTPVSLQNGRTNPIKALVLLSLFGETNEDDLDRTSLDPQNGAYKLLGHFSIVLSSNWETLVACRGVH